MKSMEMERQMQSGSCRESQIGVEGSLNGGEECSDDG